MKEGQLITIIIIDEENLKEITDKALWLWHFWFSLDHKQQSHECWKKLVRFWFFQLWFDFLYSLFSWGHEHSYDSTYNSDFNSCGNQPLNISMLCTAVFRHRKLFFEEGGQGGISSQVHKWQFCVSRVTFDLGHVFGWSLPGYKFPREASCKWVGAHWSVKWHQKTQKWSSIKPPNASQGCLAKKKKRVIFFNWSSMYS